MLLNQEFNNSSYLEQKELDFHSAQSKLHYQHFITYVKEATYHIARHTEFPGLSDYYLFMAEKALTESLYHLKKYNEHVSVANRLKKSLVSEASHV